MSHFINPEKSWVIIYYEPPCNIILALICYTVLSRSLTGRQQFNHDRELLNHTSKEGTVIDIWKNRTGDQIWWTGETEISFCTGGGVSFL